ncbi:MAG: hypothetical protein B7X60_06620 [Polynucleobacter sp. 39-45-136]|nr:MAG: hypothetical protein B7X60_06620 [Polynucleobacter sp. 39-45-136]
MRNYCKLKKGAPEFAYPLPLRHGTEKSNLEGFKSIKAPKQICWCNTLSLFHCCLVAVQKNARLSLPAITLT